MSERRFTKIARMAPELVKPLADDHPAIVNSQPMFTHNMVSAADSPRLLVGGENSKKLGKYIEKGPWKGFRLYSLTLAERTTCPRSCHQWKTCYGNAMHWARRHLPGPDLERRLLREVGEIAAKREAFAVRLHTLGDFYSVEYVQIWERLLTRHAGLHCFGYTANNPWATDPHESEIGAAIALVKAKFGTRFFIRWSSATSQPHGATVINRTPETPRVPEGLVCPAETEKTACCATCGLCWNPDLWNDCIVFVSHGYGVAQTGPKPGRPRKRVLVPPRIEAAAPLYRRGPNGLERVT